MRRSTFLLAALFLLAAPTPGVWAHRIVVGVGSQAVMILRRNEVEVALNLQYATLKALEVMTRFDKNRDRDLDSAERDAIIKYMGERIEKETSFFLDGKEIQPASVELEQSNSLLKGRIDALPFETWWILKYRFETIEPDRTYRIVYLDNTYDGEVAQQLFYLSFEEQEVDSFLIVSPDVNRIQTERGALKVDNHRRIEMEFGVLELESDEEETPPPSSGPDKPFRPEREKSEEEVETQDFRALFQRAAEGGWGLVAAIFIAAFYGAGHALGPGHGKSMVAAYLVGTRGKVRDAFILGGSATVAHTASIFAIGLLLIWVFYATMDRSQAVIQTWVGIGSGVLVGGIGAFLLPRRFRAWRSPGPGHHHDHDHGHDHGHQHHGHSHDHDHPHTGDSRRMRLASLISLGISGGAVPCPAGLVVIILAFTRKEPVLGIGLLFAFSVGLGLVLVSIGVVLVLGKSTLAARTGIGEDSRWIRVLPVVSSALIIVVGFAISYQAYLEGGKQGSPRLVHLPENFVVR